MMREPLPNQPVDVADPPQDPGADKIALLPANFVLAAGPQDLVHFLPNLPTNVRKATA